MASTSSEVMRMLPLNPKLKRWRDVKIRSISDLICHSKIDHSSKNHWVL